MIAVSTPFTLANERRFLYGVYSDMGNSASNLGDIYMSHFDTRVFHRMFPST